jgi:hypothetical protein
MGSMGGGCDACLDAANLAAFLRLLELLKSLMLCCQAYCVHTERVFLCRRRAQHAHFGADTMLFAKTTRTRRRALEFVKERLAAVFLLDAFLSRHITIESTPHWILTERHRNGRAWRMVGHVTRSNQQLQVEGVGLQVSCVEDSRTPASPVPVRLV